MVWGTGQAVDAIVHEPVAFSVEHLAPRWAAIGRTVNKFVAGIEHWSSAADNVDIVLDASSVLIFTASHIGSKDIFPSKRIARQFSLSMLLRSWLQMAEFSFASKDHSGWGGPYGDGDYPGSVDQNMNAGNTFN
jgi:hypothetical protein